MNYLLFDGPERTHLLPLTFTRPVGELRLGILTLKEKWDKYLGVKCSYLTQKYLSKKYPISKTEKNILINPAYLPTKTLVQQIKTLSPGQAIISRKNLIAAHTGKTLSFDISLFNTVDYQQDLLHVVRPYHLFQYNSIALKDDFSLLTRHRKSSSISETNRVISPQNIFLEKGATVEFCTLNASEGPVYIGQNAVAQEGCMIRGGLALCDKAVLRMGTRIYGATTIGPGSKVSGEISNSIITGYSSKVHEGFLGNSVLGQWCNLGAGTNNSNLKNSYGQVRLWNYATSTFENSELQFCGLIMGDHSKSAINTQFNTGTVVGVCANIFEPVFSKNMIPSFTWGITKEYRLSKACEVAKKVMLRRNIVFKETDERILSHIFKETDSLRKLFLNSNFF